MRATTCHLGTNIQPFSLLNVVYILYGYTICTHHFTYMNRVQ